MSSAGSHRSDPLLSIAIATRNRAKYLGLQIPQLLASLAKLQFVDYEIVVSNNHSTDDTDDVLQSLSRSDSRVKPVKPPQAFDTAEESFDYVLQNTTGKYVWTLGDDDIPTLTGIEALLRAISDDSISIYVFNALGISNKGHQFSDRKYPCIGAEFKTSFLDLLMNVGLTYVLAGYSNTVFRRERYSSEIFRENFKRSKIYSHVTTLLDLFSDTTAKFINIPLTSYRRNSYAEGDQEHWKQFTERNNLFDHFPWTLGLARSLTALVAKGRLSFYSISQIIDQSDDNRFLWISEFMNYFAGQIWLDLVRRSRVRMTMQEFQECLGFLKNVIPEKWDLIFAFESLGRVYEGAPPLGTSNERFLKSAYQELRDLLNQRSFSLSCVFQVIYREDRIYFSHAGRCFYVLRSRINHVEPFKWIDYIEHPDVNVVNRADLFSNQSYRREDYQERLVDEHASRGATVYIQSNPDIPPTFGYAASRLLLKLVSRCFPRSIREKISHSLRK